VLPFKVIAGDASHPLLPSLNSLFVCLQLLFVCSKVLQASDIPAGLVSIITGSRDQLTHALANHSVIQSIWYWGSKEVRGLVFLFFLFSKSYSQSFIPSLKVGEGGHWDIENGKTMYLTLAETWYCKLLIFSYLELYKQAYKLFWLLWTRKMFCQHWSYWLYGTSLFRAVSFFSTLVSVPLNVCGYIVKRKRRRRQAETGAAQIPLFKKNFGGRLWSGRVYGSLLHKSTYHSVLGGEGAVVDSVKFSKKSVTKTFFNFTKSLIRKSTFY